MLKRAKENKKGFTLAELLIVVAIIAVLVAISIPIFTSQLEKSREAVDLANIRAAYAEVMTAALTEDKKPDGVTYTSEGNIWSKTVTLNQKNDDWQTDVTNVTIGEVSIKDTKPKAGKTATISVSIDTAGKSTPSVTFATN